MGDLLDVRREQGGQQLVPVPAVLVEIELTRQSGVFPGVTVHHDAGEVRQGQHGYELRLPECLQQLFRLILVRCQLDMDGIVRFLRLFRLGVLRGGEVHFLD